MKILLAGKRMNAGEDEYAKWIDESIKPKPSTAEAFKKDGPLMAAVVGLSLRLPGGEPSRRGIGVRALHGLLVRLDKPP